jgi:hypothetical protein
MKRKLILSNTSGNATGSGNVTVKQGATLAGNDSLGGALVVEASAAVAPGINATGSLTAGNRTTFNDGAYFSADLNPETEEADQLISKSSIQLNGFLYLTKMGTGSFKESNQFKLFTSNSISGEFDTIIPSTPGDGLVWDTSQLNETGILKVAISTGIWDNAMESLKLYPNPVNDKLFIEIPGNPVDYMLAVFKATGEQQILLNSGTEKELMLDLSALSSGVYIVKIIKEQSTYVGKIIKK